MVPCVDDGGKKTARSQQLQGRGRFRATAVRGMARIRMKNVILSLSLALVAVTGCKKGSSDPAEKMVVMMEELANAVDGAKGDCGKMADGVEAVSKKYDLKQMKADAEKLKGDKAQAEQLEKKYGDRMKKAMPKFMGMMACAEDPKFKAVSEKLKDVM